ncbi:hypothetical protein [Paucibacter soli]|uniref:hypothetical protein n=1 Tax=Paucibacter soli TaxID=3133433 RepID=UPI0030AE599B
MSTQPDLHDLAQLARRSIEPGLQAGADGVAKSAGSCLYAALVVVLLCKKFGGYSAIVRGGPEGARDSKGIWRGHYWVEVDVPSAGVFVVDVTADQFGYEPVVVLALEQARDRYQPGPQLDVNEAFEDLAQEFQCRDMVAA